MEKNKISDTLFLTDISDYIAPSQECSIPLLRNDKKKNDKNSNVVGIFEKDSEGRYFQVNKDGSKVELKKKKIELSDCLACSGCTTTAESVLVNSQTISKFLSEIQSGKDLYVSISQESIASLGNYFGIFDNSKIFRKLNYFFHTYFNTKAVIHLNNSLLIPNVCNEFYTHYKKNRNGRKVPLITSSCPGFVCYVEKTHGSDILRYLSKLKSSQGIMGTLIKRIIWKKHSKDIKKVFHLSISPCFDKKLEGSREDLKISNHNETDLSLTTTEIIKLFTEKKIDFLKLNEMEITNESLYCDTDLTYSEYLMKFCADKIFNIKIDKLKWKKGRNSDFHSCSLKVHNKKVLNFALINGFRNIQTIIRKLKTQNCPYDFVEVYACPKGCLNGGGQIVPSKVENPIDFFGRLEKLAGEKIFTNGNKFIGSVLKMNYTTRFHDRRKDMEIEKTGKISTSNLDW